jgi:bla regulator protein blaR1
MSFLNTWTHHPLAIVIGRTLIHSLWEASVAGIILALILRATRSSAIRYAAACLTLGAIVAGLIVTFVVCIPASASGRRFDVARFPVVSPPDAKGEVSPESTNITLQKALPWITLLWIIGVVVFNLRLIGGWFAERRLRRHGVCAAAVSWQSRLDAIRLQMGVSRIVTLMESSLTIVPMVVGHIRPAVLFPVGLLAGLPSEQVELILMHELAHIRRHDYLVNTIQTFIEGLLFYHPAVWWLSKVIRAEREHGCDDMVVAAGHSAETYARALISLETSRSNVAEGAIAATGGSLMKRVRRLLYQPEPAATAWLPVCLVAFLMIAAGIMITGQPVTGVLATRAEVAPVHVAEAPPAPFSRVAQPATQPRSPQSAETRSLKTWLEQDVAYIITPEERRAYEGLRTDEEREHFIEQFWLRRDPTPGTAENEFKDEHYRRIAYANQNFTSRSTNGWKTDRGRIYIMYGKPDEIESHPSGGTYSRPAREGGGTIRTFPFEVWRYQYIEGIGNEVLLEFVDSTGSGDFKQTIDPALKRKLEQQR